MISNPHQFDYEMKEQKEKDGRNGKKKKNLQYDEKERNIGYYFSPTSTFPPMPKVYGNTPQRQNFNPRQDFDPHQNFMDPRHPRYRTTHTIMCNPRHPRYHTTNIII